MIENRSKDLLIGSKSDVSVYPILRMLWQSPSYVTSVSVSPMFYHIAEDIVIIRSRR